MINGLNSEGLTVPSYSQVNNFLSHHRRLTLGSIAMTLRERINWAQLNSNVPADFDDVFVSETEYTMKPLKFSMFMTTRRLLELGKHINRHLLSDATYKLITENYPVLTSGK